LLKALLKVAQVLPPVPVRLARAQALAPLVQVRVPQARVLAQPVPRASRRVLLA